METKPRSSQSFCARPGCGLAKSGHGFLAGACSNFIQPGSKEANEAKRAHLSVVETPAPIANIPTTCGKCGGRTDGVITAPALGGMPLAACDCEEETVETPTLSDAELLDEWKARALALGVLA